MWNALNFFLRHLFHFICYLVILYTKKFIFWHFAYLRSRLVCNLLCWILSWFPYNNLFLYISTVIFWLVILFLFITWESRHWFFLWMISLAWSGFSIFKWTFLFWFCVITIILVTLAVSFSLVYLLDLFHRFKRQLSLIIMIKCIETNTMVFGSIYNSFIFWCVI